MGTMARALLSVSDKRGLVDFARKLAEAKVELLSTGGTAKALREAGLPVIDVSEYTGSPEVMDGRVKTLHPRVHGGILMRDTGEDRGELEALGGKPIDLVVVNLYPFESTVARGAPHAEIVENIDIGGPSMLRSAAKNHGRVTVVVDPADYDVVASSIESGTDLALRTRLAAKAFAHTAAYDGAIAAYMTSLEEDGSRHPYPRALNLSLEKIYDLRYGENPHQSAAFYRDRNAPLGSLARAESIGAGGKELSFNNLVDCDAALEAVRELGDDPSAVVIKHTNPCGAASRASLADAYLAAREADALSAFGGIVALNRAVDEATARLLAETFLECVVAPSFEPTALEVLRGKKNLRLLATGPLLAADASALSLKKIDGGMVVQQRDSTGGLELRAGKVVTRRAPSVEELTDLDFAWRVCKHVKSNAIVLARARTTVGVGAGQMSRVVSVQIASEKARERSRGSVLASDAFFPFSDGLEAAARAGITAVAQPGGSVKDQDVIAAADAAGIAMVFTGFRHFRH